MIAGNSSEISVYKSILERKIPIKIWNTRVAEEEFGLRDCLEDVVFRGWLMQAVSDDRILVKEEDMLLIPSLKALVVAWKKQAPDYFWALNTFPEVVDRLATLGMALESISEV